MIICAKMAGSPHSNSAQYFRKWRLLLFIEFHYCSKFYNCFSLMKVWAQWSFSLARLYEVPHLRNYGGKGGSSARQLMSMCLRLQLQNWNLLCYLPECSFEKENRAICGPWNSPTPLCFLLNLAKCAMRRPVPTEIHLVSLLYKF